MSLDRIAMAMALSLVALVGCAPAAPKATGQPAALASFAVNGAACSGSELSACNCPNGFYCCPTDGSCFNDPSQVIYTQCTNNQGATCLMGATSGGSSSGGGGGTSTGTVNGAACSGSEVAACNCPNGYYC